MLTDAQVFYILKAVVFVLALVLISLTYKMTKHTVFLYRLKRRGLETYLMVACGLGALGCAYFSYLTSLIFILLLIHS